MCVTCSLHEHLKTDTKLPIPGENVGAQMQQRCGNVCSCITRNCVQWRAPLGVTSKSCSFLPEMLHQGFNPLPNSGLNILVFCSALLITGILDLRLLPKCRMLDAKGHAMVHHDKTSFILLWQTGSTEARVSAFFLLRFPVCYEIGHTKQSCLPMQNVNSFHFCFLMSGNRASGHVKRKLLICICAHWGNSMLQRFIWQMEWTGVCRKHESRIPGFVWSGAQQFLPFSQRKNSVHKIGVVSWTNTSSLVLCETVRVKWTLRNPKPTPSMYTDLYIFFKYFSKSQISAQLFEHTQVLGGGTKNLDWNLMCALFS